MIEANLQSTDKKCLRYEISVGNLTTKVALNPMYRTF